MSVEERSMQIGSTFPPGRDSEVVGAGGLGDLADGEREAICHGHEVRDDDHLVRLGSYMHMCLEVCLNVVGSLPRSMPKVVDYRQTCEQAMN